MQDETPKTATTATTTANPALGRSSVDKLPPALREAVNAAIADGATIDEITARIREGGESCSRSAVGRYSQNYRAMLRKRQESDRFMTQWMKEYGERPQGQAGLILIETMREMVMDTMAALTERGEPVPTQELERLTRVLKRIEDTDRLRLAREKAAAEAAKPKPKPRKGLSPETVALIRSKVEGIPYSPESPIPSYPDESQLSPEKLAEMYPEIAPRLYRTSPQSILSLGPEPEGGTDARPARSRAAQAEPGRGTPDQASGSR